MRESNENEKLKREEVIEKALSAINGDRDRQYGTPEQSFEYISNLWSAFLNIEITPTDAAVMMALFKAARIKTGANKEDNFVDGCGYFAIAGELAEVEKIKECEENVKFAKELFEKATKPHNVKYTMFTDEELAEGYEEETEERRG